MYCFKFSESDMLFYSTRMIKERLINPSYEKRNM